MWWGGVNDTIYTYNKGLGVQTHIRGECQIYGGQNLLFNNTNNRFPLLVISLCFTPCFPEQLGAHEHSNIYISTCNHTIRYRLFCYLSGMRGRGLIYAGFLLHSTLCTCCVFVELVCCRGQASSSESAVWPRHPPAQCIGGWSGRPLPGTGRGHRMSFHMSCFVRL